MKTSLAEFLSVMAALSLPIMPLQSATLGEALNAPKLTWTTGGSAGWFAQSDESRDGSSAAECGAVPEGGESWLQTTVAGPGQLSFWWKVSRPWMDTMTLVVNGTPRRTLTGRTEWTQETLSLSAGPNVIRWVVTGSFLDVAARGWLDQVYVSVFNANSATINNRYYPLAVGTKRTFRGFGVVSSYSVRGEVLGVETVDGVRCVKMVAYRPDGTLHTWYAQDSNGGVWQLRNYDVAEREYDHEDYLIMPPAPKAGEPYTLWHLDFVVVSTSAQVSTPAGTFSGCLHLRSVDSAWEGLEEYYAPGVGEIKLIDGSGGYHLVSATGLRPPTFRLGGLVSAGASGGSPVPGVTLRLTAPGFVPRSVKSDAAGRFAFQGLGARTYTATPSAYGMLFTPSQQSLALSADTDLPEFVAHDLTSPLTILTNGWGRVVRSDASPRLLIGKAYRVTAIPSAGYCFSNWVAGAGMVLTNGPTLRFVMESNLVLHANFVPNPFLPLKGPYAGLFSPPVAADTTGTNAGLIKLTLTPSGAFSGGIKVGGVPHAFSGKFDLARHATVKVPRAGKSPLWLDLGFDTASITGQVTSAAWTSGLLALATPVTRSNAFTGRYTLLVVGERGQTNAPSGDGAIALTVSSSGAVTLSGTLADGSPITHATRLTTDGLWPFHAALYGGRGVALGWMSCQAGAADLRLMWDKPADARATHFPAGFHQESPVAVARYQPPAPRRSAVPWSQGQLVLGGGNLADDLQAGFTLTNNIVKATSGSVSNVTLMIAPVSGLVNGTFRHPITRKATALRGVVIQTPLPWANAGAATNSITGWFLGPTQAGHFEATPQP